MRRFENIFTAWLLVLVFTWTSIFSASGVSVSPSKTASGDFFSNTTETTWEESAPALIPYWKKWHAATVNASGVVVDTNNHTGYAQVIEETDAAGDLTAIMVYGHDLVSQDRADGAGGFEMSFYSYDGLGSVRGLTDAIGTSLGNYHYDAYGLLIENTVSVANPYLFAGERFDDDLGLYYLRARYLDVETGRFHTLDTYEGSQQNALTLHKYLYANANPISGTDPSGRLTTQELALSFSMQANLARFGIGFASGFFITLADGYLGGKRGWELIKDSVVGGLISGVVGAIATPFMHINAVRRAAAFLGLFLGGWSSYSAASQGNIKQAVFRAVLGSFSFLGFRSPMPKINPKNSSTNCNNCVIATDSTLGGAPASALPGAGLPTSSSLKLYKQDIAAFFGSKWSPNRSSMASLKKTLKGAGSGSRAIVRYKASGKKGHLINVENVRGTLVFLDGQTGTGVFPPTGNIEFLLTNR